MGYWNTMMRTLAGTVLAACLLSTVAVAQEAAGQPAGRGGRGGSGGGRGPAVVSPEILPDGRVTFRIAAPKAESVVLSANDVTGLFSGGGAGPLAGAAPAGARAALARCREAAMIMPELVEEGQR